MAMQTANCPSCGAPVKFQSAASVFAVCGYCTSTLLRRGVEVESIGKMAALMDDPTRLQIGSEGIYKGVHFGVIGRIQLRYDAGLWNEWHIMFDDQRTGWLSQAAGETYVSFEQAFALAPPPFAGINPDDRIDLGGRFYEVTDIESATCIAGAGELPFKVGPGFAAPVVDLRLDEAFATIDYSDVADGGTPRVYVGEHVDLQVLRLSNLRDLAAEEAIAVPRVAADAFNCPSCAAPFTLSSGRIKSFGCASCGALLDTSMREVRLISKAQAQLDAPLLLPLGARGTMGGSAWQVIGHIRRASEHGFAWSEYLLFGADGGFAWLIESDGHWTFARNSPKSLKRINNQVFRDGTRLDRFAGYLAEVRHVQGECYWKVKVGDTVEVEDYIAPPLIASREKDAREVTWTVGEYVLPAEVQKAFGLPAALPTPRGVAPNQPSPWAGTATKLWQAFAAFTVLALALQIWFAVTTTEVRREQVSLKPGSDNSVLSAPFRVDGRGPLALKAETDLHNSWAGLSFTLVDPKSGKVWNTEEQLESYSGVDADGDRWSEGSNSTLVTFGDVPAGTYQLQVEAEIDPQSPRPLTAVLRLERGHASWFNWLMLQFGLLTVPLFAGWRTRAFEAARMADSDHADDDDD